MGGARGGSRNAAEEQAARAARQEVAGVPGCGGFGAARGAEAAAGDGLRRFCGCRTFAMFVFRFLPVSPAIFPHVAVPSKWCLSGEQTGVELSRPLSGCERQLRLNGEVARRP